MSHALLVTAGNCEEMDTLVLTLCEDGQRIVHILVNAALKIKIGKAIHGDQLGKCGDHEVLFLHSFIVCYLYNACYLYSPKSKSTCNKA